MPKGTVRITQGGFNCRIREIVLDRASLGDAKLETALPTCLCKSGALWSRRTIFHRSFAVHECKYIFRYTIQLVQLSHTSSGGKFITAQRQNDRSMFLFIKPKQLLDSFDIIDALD